MFQLFITSQLLFLFYSMDKSFVRINFTAVKWDLNIAYSMWLIVGCLGLGVLYAWMLYFYDSKNSSSLNFSVRNILAFCRFILVAILSFLLLEPVVKHINYIKKKLYIFKLLCYWYKFSLIKNCLISSLFNYNYNFIW